MGRNPAQRSRLERLWQSEPSLAGALAMVPLRIAGALFRGSVAARNLWWRRMARSADLPLISVGNLTVGGNAKTPFTLFLASRLQNRGLRVAIASRGYGGSRSVTSAALVADRGELKYPPEQSGDEPAMMSRRFSGPIAIARRRLDAIATLARQGPLDVVILDDGFQHTRLKRELDLVVVSDQSGFGNRRMLPAGPMREPLAALRRADAIVIVSFGTGHRSAIRAREMELLGRHRVLHARVRPCGLVTSAQGHWQESAPLLAGRRVIAVSGLANPATFYSMVREIDADLVGVLEYPDHHAYTWADWQTIATAARAADAVITTEKDLIKLERFPFARDSLYALRLEVSLPEEELRTLDDLIFTRLRGPGKINSAAAPEVSHNVP
ncbi:MAG: tetraacyldisaccharide 4'-kinase [Deltaproteobacteria bacterium]|nr:tetraacyldisaccharide 4'-kinase [Deltaproteobacteria bacterium]